MTISDLNTLAERYSAPCPRYTSYPTAVEMQAGQCEFPTLKTPVSLYIHLPYCKQTCLFCACNRLLSSNPTADKATYINLIDKELSLHQTKLSFDSIHLGGGTPSFFDESELTKLNETIERHATFLPDAEKSIEIDPRTFSEPQAKVLQDFGYTRASLGVQDFDPAVEKAIGRRQSIEETAKCTEILRNNGFTGINFDLVYGLPLQSKESFKKTLKEVLELAPERVALYGFAYVPWKAKQQAAIDSNTLPDSKTRLELFLMARELFINAGYSYIGLDHFAKKSDPLLKAYTEKTLKRNFMGYTTTGTNGVLGLGVSAISDIDGILIQNFSDLANYKESLDKNTLPESKFYCRTQDDLIRGAIIEEIMCYAKLNFNDLSKTLHSNIPLELFQNNKTALEGFVDDGILEIKSETIIVREQLFLRQVAALFDIFLQNHLKKEKKTFSQGA